MRASSVRASTTDQKNDSLPSRRSAASAKLRLIKRAGTDRTLSAAAHQILSHFVNWANEDGLVSGKSVNYIASAVERDRATVIRSFSQLCERGYLERIGRHNSFGNGPNDYYLCFDIDMALRANARELKRQTQDKKRAPCSGRRTDRSKETLNGQPAAGGSRSDATVRVASTTPSESHRCDTDNPSSSLSFPYRGTEALNNAANTPSLENPIQGADGKKQGRSSNSLESRKGLEHSDRDKAEQKNEAANNQVDGRRSFQNLHPYSCTTQETEAARRHRFNCQERVNTAITEHDSWELIRGKEELDKAYRAEIYTEGKGVVQILKLLQKRSTGNGTDF